MSRQLEPHPHTPEPSAVPVCALCHREAAESTWRGIPLGWLCRLMLAGRESAAA